jgi:hypothetical protein
MLYLPGTILKRFQLHVGQETNLRNDERVSAFIRGRTVEYQREHMSAFTSDQAAMQEPSKHRPNDVKTCKTSRHKVSMEARPQVSLPTKDGQKVTLYSPSAASNGPC